MLDRPQSGIFVKHQINAQPTPLVSDGTVKRHGQHESRLSGIFVLNTKAVIDEALEAPNQAVARDVAQDDRAHASIQR